ncbi:MULTISPECIES: type II secretion system minor pseudopilin GspI [Aliagarivorans]|uniref:type II secretion system minor pseudopilin GspI n=1 Tax=Aliagarivorans TaxID=882379 RepID=UPI0004235436|nr:MULTISPECIES: type II secretion system minor pseudopilin GspI [Aliagarivorans]
MKRQRGMTLLEVMVAMAILATAGAAVVKAAAENLNSISFLREKSFALWVADNRLSEIKLSGAWPGTALRKGEEEFADRTWYWQSQGVETASNDFLAVRVTVSKDKEGKQVMAELTSYVSR